MEGLGRPREDPHAQVGSSKNDGGDPLWTTGRVVLRTSHPDVMRRLLRSWRARVAVDGRSMAPALLPGDWLLVDPEAYHEGTPSPGALVLVPDPRAPARLLVKRVASVSSSGTILVRGDALDASTDSRTFGAVEASTVEGRPWFRYWPLRRIGRVA